MKMKRARIQNFRCLVDAEIRFDEVTSIIGPNGVGKSTVLRALDWFFNGEKSVALTDSDVCESGSDKKILVEVEFSDLTETDKASLGHYAPPDVDNLVLWRSWESGEDKITGKALSFPAFQEVRSKSGAMEKRRAYNALRDSQSELGLPPAGSVEAVNNSMITWERENNHRLTATLEEVTEFFGFAGQGKLSSLFEYILVSADLRALEEAIDTRKSIFGRIIERAIDRRVADAELAELEARSNLERAEISSRRFGPQLERISREISDAVGVFSTGRNIRISSSEAPSKPSKPVFNVRVLDGQVETAVEKQGHGFQRAMIISALKLLSDRHSTGGRSGSLCLAIEEPELYQHPVQARAFASVLRRIAEDATQNTQVAYATHNPIFVEPRKFHEIRRISREKSSDNRPYVSISHVTVDNVTEELTGYIDSSKIAKQLENACLNKLSEAMFASAVLLVEGTTDKAIFEGYAERESGPLTVDGIYVADANGKIGLMLSHAILNLLGIPCYVVFDGDIGTEERKFQNSGNSEDAAKDAQKSAAENMRLLRYLGHAAEQWPPTRADYSHASFADRLEDCLRNDWAEWYARVQELISTGLGYSGKNSFTYYEAARTATGQPPAVFAEIIQHVRGIAK
ncbi:ATP-dependent nuclease [Kitasatospora sp. NBC_01302]|uniref:ATP-dependent nuclease n=1 Tax=Kitasatospora sp. NBC_01302 TaxID=2903575 RepID=UPI002E1649A4|nr:ATP-dependent endonuclease [Kitasatospora sp. NBC_01302]